MEKKIKYYFDFYSFSDSSRVFKDRLSRLRYSVYLLLLSVVSEKGYQTTYICAGKLFAVWERCSNLRFFCSSSHVVVQWKKGPVLKVCFLRFLSSTFIDFIFYIKGDVVSMSNGLRGGI